MVMDSNNHFNYGTHSSANSGLKRSSGDSSYTNGSSMSFPQQGKNMNGEMNVNGVTTVLGSNPPGSRPPSAPYPHMSSHHQSSMGYDYLWGGHTGYGAAMGTALGHGMHQKQPTPGMVQPQSQHPFQGHGHYQLNGGVETSHHPPAAGPANTPVSGNQYWNRGNLSPQQMSFSPHSMYGTYQSQAHAGVTVPQQQQQQQQASTHHPSQQHLPSHRHHHQQPQLYSMMANGMPYFQHQPQQPPVASQDQGQAQMMAPAAQSFSPPRGSPQQHTLSRGNSGSPLPVAVSTVPAGQEGGSPKAQNAERSSVGVSSSIQGHLTEAVKKTDSSFNGSERTASSSYQCTSPAPSGSVGDGCSEKPTTYQETASPSQSMSSRLPVTSSTTAASASLIKASTPHGAPPLATLSGSPSSTPPQISSPPRMSFASSTTASSRLSSPPVLVKGPQAPTLVEMFPSEPKQPPAGPSSPSKSVTATKPATVFSAHAVSVLKESVVQTKSVLSHTGPSVLSTTVSPPIIVSTSSRSEPSDEKRTLHVSEVTSCFPGKPQSPHGNLEPEPSKLMSPPASPALCSPASVLKSKLCEPAPWSQSNTLPAAASGFPTVSARRSGVEGVIVASSAACASSPVRSLSTLPLLTTQASRTAPVPPPHPLVDESSPYIPRSEAGQSLNARRSSVVKPFFPKLEHHHHHNRNMTDVKVDPGVMRTSQIEVKKASSVIFGLSEKTLQTTVHPDQTQTMNERRETKPMDVSCTSESEESMLDGRPFRNSSQLSSTRVDMVEEKSLDSSLQPLSDEDSSSTYNTPSRFEKSSQFLSDSSCKDASTRLCSSSVLLREDSSQFDCTSSNVEEEPSALFNSTQDSFSEDDCREGLNSTTEGETSEGTRNSSHITGASMLDSSINGSKMEQHRLDSRDVSNNLSQPESQEWEESGHDAPDSAGGVHMKTPACEAMTPPNLKMTGQNFITCSTPAANQTFPQLQPVPDLTPMNTAGNLQAAGKRRKSRTPKTMWIKTTDPEETQLKTRVRTPKAEKKTSDEEGAMKEEGVSGRKRKRSVKGDVEDEDLDSVTDAINAVLANTSPHSITLSKAKKLKMTLKRVKQQDQDGNIKSKKVNVETGTAEDGEEHDDSSTAGESNKRRVATEEQVQFPLRHGWRREIRVKKLENRMKGETWYYTPCGRRMKQFPEVIKYLKKHADGVVSREHFSFSPRMPVGDFYEERETAEGLQWVLLANEEIPSMIMAITGRRGRPPNPDKEKLGRPRALKGAPARRPGRPSKLNPVDLLSKVDAKLLQRLEAKGALTEEDKVKLAKIKKKMRRKARVKRREDAKIKKLKLEKKRTKLEQAVKHLQAKVEPTDESAAEPKKPGRRRTIKVEAAPSVQPKDERMIQSKRVLGARSKAKALAKAQAEAEAAAQAALAAKKSAERRVQAQRRLEERKRQQLIAEELKKPTEDMCLTDHKPLPELSRIPGVVLSGTAFAHCLAVVEFLHGYGKLMGLNIPKDIPSLVTLQEGLLGLGDSQGEVQDLLIKLMEIALQDPGLPSYYQSVKILGDKLVDLELTRSTVSEVLRIFLESHGYETEVCDTLRTKTFHALPPDTKAAILGFLVDELNGNNVVTSDIDNTLENMTTYRKNKWIIEGKLRKLKTALARRTGRSEEEICFEERRRSARVAEEENLNLVEKGLALKRGNRRGRKEEPKLSDSESPNNASIPELERQIDKLTKRQAFFRKKLLQSSHSMRAILLGQDRYRRRYIALPHLGGVFVEGAEELLTSEDILVAEVPVAFLKNEPKDEELATPTTPPNNLPGSPSAPVGPALTSSAEDDDPLPGTASLMSQPRGRGRPRKIKPEVELHLRTAKIRRRRRSSVRSVGDVGPGLPNNELTQAALQSWLSQSQEAASTNTCSGAGEAPEGHGADESVKEMAEKRGQWFNLLPKQPCDDDSLSEPQMPPSPRSPPKLLPQIFSPQSSLDPQLEQASSFPPNQSAAEPETNETPQGLCEAETIPQLPPTLLPSLPTLEAPPLGPPALTAPALRAAPKPGRRRRRGSRGSSPARRGPRGAAAKRRGRPPNAVFQELEQQYFTQLVVKPIPASMMRGWWWIKDPEELYNTLQALHPRGIREKVLHKHLAKHMESLTEMCTKSIDDQLFDVKEEKKNVWLEALQQPWQVQEKAMETDVLALQRVEDLEQRVVAADLHLKAPPLSAIPDAAVTDAETDTETPIVEFQPYTIPDSDATRDDLQYYEHDADPRDDWIVRTKKEWSNLPRIATHPLDLAVLRLANLERNIERRYLKEPLWNPAEVMRLAPLTPTPGEEQIMDVISLESEITSRMRTWRQALDRCRSAPQVVLCLHQLEKAIAWERSVTKVNCQVCRKGDNDECLLLCDGCDRGCHMYCLKPKITQVPEGDWFCPTCVAKEETASPRSSKTRTRVKKKRYEDDSSDDESTTRRSGGGMATRHKEPAPNPSSSSRNSGEAGSSAKRRRMTTRNQPDLTFCEIILMEMEAHTDAWPFLEPVNPRLVPGYRRLIKNPMDFLTMRERLLQGGYCSCEEFAADAHLVFNNCEMFNEDTSEVGMAGHSMRKFFESRWAEFYSNKDK
ncbi:bromodomain adjacent to zinc finger domain protein 2A isoform X2 [Gouania willdenowi]|uniref:bromodomain adjacent to zinc finger domain protein 2A isoform X2 n=1 Tax=Gouania willdenowi TaxID=441366 RepID=UPI0010563C82|nr:bromodomain adjacent to zinc finger domain protein 2A isoform X2 [Gouania willdenowi]